MGAQPSIFVSYAHADTKWLNELTPQLHGLKLHAKIDVYDDRRLLGGDDWDAEVKAALDRADIVLLLVTANFIGSEYIHRVELPKALGRRKADGAIVVPVLLNPVLAGCFRSTTSITCQRTARAHSSRLLNGEERRRRGPDKSPSTCSRMSSAAASAPSGKPRLPRGRVSTSPSTASGRTRSGRRSICRRWRRGCGRCRYRDPPLRCFRAAERAAQPPLGYPAA